MYVSFSLIHSAFHIEVVLGKRNGTVLEQGLAILQ